MMVTHTAVITSVQAFELTQELWEGGACHAMSTLLLS